MKAEQGLQLADVREAFLKWNKLQYAQLPAILSADHIKLVRLLPFLLQINNRLMPGYTGYAVPAGVYAYVPDNEALDIAREINNKFHYQQDEVITYHAVDAVYLQHQLVDNKLKLWIFYRSRLDEQQINDLSDKVKKIFQWISSRGLKLSYCLIADNDFRNKPELTWQKNKQLMLDNFYSEIVLLAGKYPLWWLVPLASEHKYEEFTEHIKQARLVDIDGFIDLGSPADVEHSDMLIYAISIAQEIKQSAEICLIKLLIVNQRSAAWPAYDGVSFRIKKWLVLPEKQPGKQPEQQQKSDPVDILAGIMSDAFSLLPLDSHISLPDRLITKVKNSSTRVNKKLLDAFLGDKLSHEAPLQGVDSIIYRLNLFKALSHEISQLFTNIVTHFSRQKTSTEIDESLLAGARNMQKFLADSSSRIPLYNDSAMEIILSRILLKHEIHTESAESWSLVLESAEGQEKIIEGFNSLLGLLAWCWLNNVVNLATQVSIDCPLQQVKQTEARFILEILIQQLNPAVLDRVSNGVSDKNTVPVLSLLFVNFKGVNKNHRLPLTSIDVLLNSSIRSTHLLDHCEQLIIDNRGDVYTRQYSGDSGLLRCLCEWTHHAPLDGEIIPQGLNVFGHGTGESTFVAQRVEQVYAQLIDFFYTLKVITGRFMLSFAEDYYVIKAENSLLTLSLIGSKKAFIEYLEAPVAQFQLSCLERLAYAEEPLREIYQKNKDNVLQVFFRITNRGCQSWVLDEKGSLCKCLVSRTSRESYIAHWLYLFKNIRKVLKDSFKDSAINSDKNSTGNKGEKLRDLPSLEINQLKTNPLGGIDFYVVGADEFSDKKNYLDIQIEITDKNHFDQFNLLCGDRRFDFKAHRHNVLKQCASYVSEQRKQQGWQPVYVTDIKVPLKALNVLQAEELQSRHLLKFKRQFESRLNKLLELQT